MGGAQLAQNVDDAQPEEALPKVFLLGEHQSQYEKEVPQYVSLLEACDNEMKVAFEKWLSMISEMEAYAKKIEYPLEGIKLWLHVFWDKEGNIEHIGYYLRPNSKNVDLEELSAFFSSFVNQYKFPLTAEQKFHHYTSVSFPAFSKRIKELSNGGGR